MKSYDELIEIVMQNKKKLIRLIRKAHEISLQDEHSGQVCSIVAIGRENGEIVHPTIAADDQRDDLYILVAYPHINPIEAVVLYADEKAAILNNWCLEQGTMAPEQGEDEGDVAYLARLVSWIRSNTTETAGEILIDLIRSQLLADFHAETELHDALAELSDRARGIVRLPPADEEAEPEQEETGLPSIAVPPELIRFAALEDGEEKEKTDQD